MLAALQHNVLLQTGAGVGLSLAAQALLRPPWVVHATEDGEEVLDWGKLIKTSIGIGVAGVASLHFPLR